MKSDDASASPGTGSASVSVHTVNGPAGRIQVRTIGSGPTIVMIAPLGRSATDFDALAVSVAAHGYRVAAPEPRGLAGTEGLTSTVSLDDLAADVAAVIKHFGSSATVLGHAFGNRLARMTATRYPDLVERVILLACGGQTPPGPQAAQALQDAYDVRLTPEQHLEAVRIGFFAPGNDPSAWRGGWHPDVAAMQKTAAQHVDPDVWWTAGTTVPVLIVQGAQDAIAVPANSQQLAADIGQRATLITIDNAGHAMLPEQLEHITDAIVGWLPKP